MIKSIKKFSYEKRSEALGLLTMKKGMSNLQTVMKAKVKVRLIHTHTHKGRGKSIRKSEMGGFPKRLLDSHRGTQNFQA